ncbi:MAG: mannosyltransferase family protein [Prochlorothrix sp.]
MNEIKQPWYWGWRWVTGAYLSSRFVVLLLLVVIPTLTAEPGSPHLENPWFILTHWDGEWYRSIAEQGYSYAPDGQEYNVAFFPLFPLLVRGLMAIGLPFPVAAIFLSNLCFWAVLLRLFGWMARTQNEAVARWTVLFLAWCPWSYYSSIAYTESLFLWVTLSALIAFEQKDYGGAALWGMLASATRLPGIVLVPTFGLLTWLQGRSPQGYLAAGASSLGVVAYSLYCGWKFDAPLAFIAVQEAWEARPDFLGQNWWLVLLRVIFGRSNVKAGLWEAGGLVDPVYPVLVVLLLGLGGGLWWTRQRWPRAGLEAAVGVLTIALWLVMGDEGLTLVLLLGSGGLLWAVRDQFNPTALIYSCFAFLLLLATGRTLSFSRLVYGIVTLTPALALFLHRSPRLAAFTLGFFVLLLITHGLRFGQGFWVA